MLRCPNLPVAVLALTTADRSVATAERKGETIAERKDETIATSAETRDATIATSAEMISLAGTIVSIAWTTANLDVMSAKCSASSLAERSATSAGTIASLNAVAPGLTDAKKSSFVYASFRV